MFSYSAPRFILYFELLLINGYMQALRFDPKKEEVIELTTGAVVTGVWKTADPRVLEVLSDLHIWGPDFLESRLKWRPRDPITIVELRGYRYMCVRSGQ